MTPLPKLACLIADTSFSQREGESLGEALEVAAAATYLYIWGELLTCALMRTWPLATRHSGMLQSLPVQVLVGGRSLELLIRVAVHHTDLKHHHGDVELRLCVSHAYHIDERGPSALVDWYAPAHVTESTPVLIRHLDAVIDRIIPHLGRVAPSPGDLSVFHMDERKIVQINVEAGTSPLTPLSPKEVPHTAWSRTPLRPNPLVVMSGSHIAELVLGGPFAYQTDDRWS